MIRCEECGEEITNPLDKTNWIRVTGWVQNGAKTTLRFPTAPHGYAHGTCMTDRKYREQLHGDSLF